MRDMKKLFGMAALAAFVLCAGARASESKGSGSKEVTKVKLQTTCPIDGSKIDKSVYVDHEGKRIYACGRKCLAVLTKDAHGYLVKLEARGITLETPLRPAGKTAVTLCLKCGEIKGAAKCCKPEGRTKCTTCSLFKGSPGCCKIPKGSKTAELCTKCGELKGAAKCCKAEGREKCDKCGLFKSSPGCCNMPWTALSTLPYNGEWLENFAKAKAIAAQKKRPMMLNFTGSDWCGWCIRLHGEVFDKKEFKSYAAKNLVLVKVDFPRRRTLSAETKQQNRKLAKRYAIRGFPTIIVLDSTGKQLGVTGYVPGGPSAFLSSLKGILKKKAGSSPKPAG